MATWKSRGLRGQGLEEMLNFVNDIYLQRGLALIQKIPTPITPIEIDKKNRHITLAYFDKKSTVDYIGAVQGIPVCFDAKECAYDRFSLANIHEHQIEFMKNFRNVKAENNMSKDLKIMFETDSDIELVVNVLRLNDNIVTSPLNIKSYKVLSNNIKATVYFEKKETEADKQAREAKIKALQESIEKIESRLSNENYVNKAPEAVVAKDRQQVEDDKKKLAELMK